MVSRREEQGGAQCRGRSVQGVLSVGGWHLVGKPRGWKSFAASAEQVGVEGCLRGWAPGEEVDSALQVGRAVWTAPGRGVTVSKGLGPWQPWRPRGPLPPRTWTLGPGSARDLPSPEVGRPHPSLHTPDPDHPPPDAWEAASRAPALGPHRADKNDEMRGL